MSYNTIADYSEVTEGNVFPFKIELDMPNCVLNPNQHENQKFCYIVTAVGSDDDSHKNLEYIVFGINEKITVDQIQNITVVINGKEQNVKFNQNKNDNVTLNNSDENADCKGLKFEFKLSKKSDVMIIAFELLKTCEVGSVPVCMYGDDAVQTGLTIGGPKSDIYNPGDDKDPDDDNIGKHGEWFDNPVCDEIGYKVFDIYVPVSIKPYAHVYKPVVNCLDKAQILSGCIHCDNEYESCDFTITQELSVKVPVKYGVLTYYDNICIEDKSSEMEHTHKD